MNSLVSIIVPVYNVEKYLDRCIDSLAKQTYQFLEIILIDDASTDRSSEICKKWSRIDRRVKLYSLCTNEGVSAARNLGMKKASADYVMFVDSDDFLSTTAVQEMLERLLQDGSELVQGKRTHIFEDGSTLDEERTWMHDAVLTSNELFAIEGLERGKRGACEFWAKLYKKEVLDGLIFPALKYGEDLWVYPEIISRCKKISIIDSPIYYYMNRSDSVTKAPSLQAMLAFILSHLYSFYIIPGEIFAEDYSPTILLFRWILPIIGLSKTSQSVAEVKYNEENQIFYSFSDPYPGYVRLRTGGRSKYYRCLVFQYVHKFIDLANQRWRNLYNGIEG